MNYRKREKKMEEEKRYDKYGFIHESNFQDYQLSAVDASVVEQWKKIIKNADLQGQIPLFKVRRLAREGVPEEMRGKVWCMLANLRTGRALEQTHKLYEELSAKGPSEVDGQIELDLARTFITNIYFEEKNGEGQRQLSRVLNCYARYDEAVGYCQGMSFIAGVLLMVLPANSAFHVLLGVMGEMKTYFAPSMWELLEDGEIFCGLLAQTMPHVLDKLRKNKVTSKTFSFSFFFLNCFSFLQRWNQ